MEDIYMPLLLNALDKIEAEYCRLADEKVEREHGESEFGDGRFQRETLSPFENTGAFYSNPTFVVRAYCWDGIGSQALPNFEYGPIRIWWFERSHCGTEVYSDIEVTPELIAKMLTDCVVSVKEDFV